MMVARRGGGMWRARAKEGTEARCIVAVVQAVAAHTCAGRRRCYYQRCRRYTHDAVQAADRHLQLVLRAAQRALARAAAVRHRVHKAADAAALVVQARARDGDLAVQLLAASAVVGGRRSRASGDEAGGESVASRTGGL